MYTAIGQRDYPMLQGGFLILTVSVILLNFAADLLVLPARPEDQPVTLPLQDPQLATETGAEPSRRCRVPAHRAARAQGRGHRPGDHRVLHRTVDHRAVISPYSTTQQTCAVYAPPSAAHWLGCDDGGIDMLSEIMQGGRISLIVGFAATLVAMIIGGGVGILSGYFTGASTSR